MIKIETSLNDFGLWKCAELFGLATSFVEKMHKKEATRRARLVLKRAPKPNLRITSSASMGPSALERIPAKPIIPIEWANFSTGAKSEHIVKVAVMLTPQPIPINARKTIGKYPASLMR